MCRTSFSTPKAPHLGYIWGTQCTPPTDGKYFEKIEKFGTLIFYLVLFIDGGGGPKTKNDQNDQKLMKMKKINSKKIN